MMRAFIASVLLAIASFASAADLPVQLLLPSRTLAPSGTFDLRFAAEMIPRDQIGVPAAESPLEFDPPIKGQFYWLSTRSGAFTPSGVLPLGTTFRITLRKDLKDAAGHEIHAKLNQTAETPGMRVKGVQHNSYFNEEDAPGSPRLSILFNTSVVAADAAKYLQFVNTDGVVIPARVQQVANPMDSQSPFYQTNSDDHTLLTWRERAKHANPATTDDEDASPALPTRANILAVAPEKPLPPGKGWQLVISAGLPSSEWKTALPESKKISIGLVKPFVVSEIKADNGRHSGPVLSVTLSKELAESITDQNAAQWVSISPQPKDLKITVDLGSSAINLSGQFSLGAPYHVKVNAGLPSMEPFTLLQSVEKDVVFERIAPRLYFQDITTHQLATGTRQFRILSINVPRLRVTARYFPADAVPAAIHAFAGYSEPKIQLPDDESYIKVDPNQMPGKTIWEKEFATAADVDKQVTVPLNWNEILGDNKSGAVLLTAESVDPVAGKNKRCGAQAIVQVTDLGVVWKRSKSGIFAHVFSLATGRPIESAKLRMLDDKHQLLGEAVTDARGIAQLPAAGETGKWMIVEHDGDAHAIELASGENEAPIYRLGIQGMDGIDEDRADEARTVFLFTERDVYKPGDLVRLKGIVRDLSGDQPRTPAGEKLTMTLSDAQSTEVFRGEMTLSEFGAFEKELKLPLSGLGAYRIAITSPAPAEGAEPEEVAAKTVQVEEYKPNSFEVAIAQAPDATGPARLSLPVTAKYLMGMPLTDAKVAWTLVARDTPFAPTGLDDYAFCDAISESSLLRALDRVSQLNDQGEVDVKAGAADVSFALSINPKAPQPRAAKLLCEVTDLNQQTVSESRSFVRQSSDYYFGLRRFRSLLKAGEAIPIQLIAVDANGSLKTAPAKASLKLTRIQWQTNRLATAADATEYESKPVFEVVWQSELQTLPPGKENGRLIPKAASPAALIADKPGQYLLEASGKDDAGHDILTSLCFFVSGNGEMVWNYQNPYAIDVVPDKDAYAAGEKATLLIKTPIAGEALVTMERNHVLRSFITTLQGNAPTVEVPLTAEDAPNVFVSVMMLRGADDSPRKIKAPEYRLGYCELKIARPEDKLAVYVKPSASAFRPGELVNLDVEVLDFQGKPSADSEVTLYAVDEGVLSLTGYKTPDPLAFFQLPRRLGVQTSLTLPTLLREDLAEAEFTNKGYLVGDGKGGAGDNDGLRKNFLACALWSATARTGADGHLHSSFTAPDSLTRYRIMAVAMTRNSQFGSGESSIEVNKPVMLEPSLPRFANLGDKLALRGVLHNATDLNGEVDVTLQLDKTAHAAETTRHVALPARGSVAVDFPVEMTATGDAQWRWSATFHGADGKTTYSDEVQSNLKITYPAPLVREVHTSRVEGAKAEILKLSNPQLIEGNGIVQVTLTNTRAVELGEALRQVLHYPYGCVEQTTSNMLPWLTLRDLRGALPELAKTEEEIASQVDRGVHLLLSMQTDSGGLAYWPGGTQPNLWGSAYGGLGLALAKKQGFPVPKQAYDSLMKYLSAELRGTSKEVTGYGLSDHCLAVYTLAVAGTPEPAYHELLFKKRAALTAEDRALLALALIESHGPKSMIDALLKDAPDENTYVDESFGCFAREDAMHLLAWTLHDPHSRRVDELATDLFRRRTAGHWATTQGNAWSLLALSAYLRDVEHGNPTASGEIAWAGSKEPFALNKSTQLVTATFPIQEKNANEPIEVTKNADGQVFSEVTAQGRPLAIEQPRQDQGYSITRRYMKIEDSGKLTPAENLKVGDRVLVSLEIEARRRATYVAIEDPLPAVFEAINPVFKTQEAVAGEFAGQDMVSSYRELRDDRALFFADLVSPGRYTLRYLARVNSAGTATAPAAKIEEMYHPERFGKTETTKVTTEALRK